ncbi:MAG TPA: CPBP family intramembrane glutamic endopeptidase [Gemmatimonadaceae bacterium]|nr:CPBP family intramembrane glutamic endopeptidase [Gemmatimonadaceae bacterium]
MAASLLRLAGLAVGTGALVRATWALRGDGRFPLAAMVRAELGRGRGRRGAVPVCIAGGVALVAAPVGWSLRAGDATLAVDPRWVDVTALALLGTAVLKLLLVVFEELAFRAGVMRAFAPRLGLAGAIVLGAFAFAAAHGRGAAATAVLFVDGVGFAVAYASTRSLRAPIAWHAAKNFTVWLIAGQGTVQLAAGPLRVLPTGAADAGSVGIELVATIAIVVPVAAWLSRPRASGSLGTSST